MGNKKIWTVGKRWTPAGAVTETVPVFAVRSGVRCSRLVGNVVTAEVGGSATQTVGDATDVDGFFTDAVLAAGTAGIKDSAGAFVATAGGKLYTADDTIDIVHTVTTDPTTRPVIDFKATFEREIP